MEFYWLNTNYYHYLKQWDKRVPIANKKKHFRPFLGPFFLSDMFPYYLPLTSPKKKHQFIYQRGDIILIEEGRLGAINVNNMLPLPQQEVCQIQIEQMEDNKYKKLLQKQLLWCIQNKEMIQRKVNNIYLLYHKIKKEQLCKRCCDFPLLELNYYLYIGKNKLQEEEQTYQYA